MDAQEDGGYTSNEFHLHYDDITLDASSAPPVGSSALWKRRRKHGEKCQRQGLQTCEIPLEADVAKRPSEWTQERNSPGKQLPEIVVTYNRKVTRTLSLPEQSPRPKVLNSKSSPLATFSELKQSPSEHKAEPSQDMLHRSTNGAFASTPFVKRSPLVSNFFTWDVATRENLQSLPVSKEFGVKSCQNLSENSLDYNRSNWRKIGTVFDETAVTDSTLWFRKPPHHLPPLDPSVFEEKRTSPKAGCTSKKKNDRSTPYSSGEYLHGPERQKIKTAESTLEDTEGAHCSEANTLLSSKEKFDFQVRTSPVAANMPAVSRPATDVPERCANPRCDGTGSMGRKQPRSQSFNWRGVESGKERYLSQNPTPIPHSTSALPAGASSTSHGALRRHRKAVCEGAESSHGNKERITARVLMKKFGDLTLSEKNSHRPPTNPSI